MINLHQHGGRLDQLRHQYPKAPQPWLDLSTGIAPFSYPVELDVAVLSRLPSAGDFDRCRRAMATAFQVSPDYVLPVPGLESVIRWLPSLLGGPLYIEKPTYGDYELAWRLANLPLCSELTHPNAVHILCQPNNPTGSYVSLHQLREYCHLAKERQGWLVIDEAYIDASEIEAVSFHATNMIVLRSFGKFFGLPGVRLGSVLAESKMLAKIKSQLGDWPVSTLALSLGASAYGDKTWQTQQRETLHRLMTDQYAVIKNLGFEIIGKTDLFLCLNPLDAAELWHHLMTEGIYTRLFSKANLLRIGLAKDLEQLVRLQNSLRLYLQRDSSH